MRAAQQDEGSYVIESDDVRADYADLVAEALMHPFISPDAQAYVEHVRELHEELLALNGHVVRVIEGAEAAFLRDSGKIAVDE